MSYVFLFSHFDRVWNFTASRSIRQPLFPELVLGTVAIWKSALKGPVSVRGRQAGGQAPLVKWFGQELLGSKFKKEAVVENRRFLDDDVDSGWYPVSPSCSAVPGGPAQL